ncbi:hypothetical protein FA15DRAFT_667829 [Coprinopsis marcescibilis]|uniref:WW domain-containing protein n=1 Tax=Coprinopsis marcescibilis TaxID=230819 RepID=A0A5C3LCM9_COPMA|nr:hypothetical protein FA15DRAFT_667829 [Coprinopsis marcescibilis]
MVPADHGHHHQSSISTCHSTLGLGINRLIARVFSLGWRTWPWSAVLLAFRRLWALLRIIPLRLWTGLKRVPSASTKPQTLNIGTDVICASRVPENLLKESSVPQPLEMLTSPAGTLGGSPKIIGTDRMKPAHGTDLPASANKKDPFNTENMSSTECPPIPIGPSVTMPCNFTHEMSNEIPGLVFVTTVKEYERYAKNFIYEQTNEPYIIPACTMDFPGPVLPDQWISYVHPEGTRYYVKPTSNLSLITEARIDDADQYQKIDHYFGAITEYIRKYNIQLPPNPFLVLELRNSGNCGYYFVNHQKRCLFWLDSFDYSDMVQHVRIKHTTSHVGLQMLSHYWYHNELFPHLYHLTDENLHEIDDMVVFAIGDQTTSGNNSISTFEMDTLKQAQSTIMHFRHKDSTIRNISVGAAWFIFRLFTTFYEDRFIYLHGEKGARLQPSQTIFGIWENSWFFETLNAIMLFGPGVHIRKLKSMSIDNIVTEKVWQKFRKSILDDWRDVVLYATVVLSANVSFQTVQSVDNEGVELGHRSHAQRASDFSIVASVGTIIFGLLLLRQHREVMTNAGFLVNRSASRSGIETLAIMYSVPYALLLWSMLSFFASFCIVWFKANDSVSTILISITCGCIALLLLWGISAAYEQEPYVKLLFFRGLDRLKLCCQRILANSKLREELCAPDIEVESKGACIA